MLKLEDVDYFVVSHAEVKYVKMCFTNAIARTSEKNVQLILEPIGLLGFKIILQCTGNNRSSKLFFDRLYRARQYHTIRCSVNNKIVDLRYVLSKEDRDRLLNRFKKL